MDSSGFEDVSTMRMKIACNSEMIFRGSLVLNVKLRIVSILNFTGIAIIQRLQLKTTKKYISLARIHRVYNR